MAETRFAGSLADVQIRPPGDCLFSLDTSGQLTYVQEEILDEVATVLWNQVVDKDDEGYPDDFPYDELPLEDKAWLRKVAMEAIYPLVQRLLPLIQQP